MRLFKIPITLIAIVVTALNYLGCKEGTTDYQREKEYLDSIGTKIKAIDVALNVDEKELQNRIALINTWYIDLKDTSYDVAKKMQIDFNGFKVVYNKYIDNFFRYSVERDLIKEQFDSLSKQAKEGSINREEFKKAYKLLSQKTDKTYLGVTTIAKPVYDLEPSWLRYYKEKE
jgi:hypothetical protein